MKNRTKRTKGERKNTNTLRASTMLFAMAAFLITGFVSAFSFQANTAEAQSETNPPACTVVANDNLAGYWKFDDATGTIALDSSGQGHNGTVYNGATWLTGSSGVLHANALQFDGVNDMVSIPGGDFAFGNASFTVSLFTKASADGANRSVLGDYNAGRGWGLYYYGNGVNFFGYGDAGTNDMNQTQNVLDGQWHHVAGVFTRSGASLKIDTYVDGNFVGSRTSNVGNISSGSDLLLGKYMGQPSYLGAMDDVRVYGRALSASEVQSLSVNCQPQSSSSSSVSSSSSSVSSSSSSSVSSSVSSSSSSVDRNAPTCDGKTATIYVAKKNTNYGNWWYRRGRQQYVVVGGPMNGQVYQGILRGTDGNDVIVGTDGADVIGGKGGDDVICAGKGNDFVYGDSGADTVYVGNGQNTVIGNDGNDKVTAGNGRNVVLGNTGDDTITVGNGQNIIDGGEGNNVCTVGHGRNIVLRCNGQDMMTSGSGSMDEDRGE